ncbi:hypothetical protein WBG78_08855 [Chryseolinea sp. T2]|uniref:hypothetical protein n=1 Tax=Chryseolinea sp. T2 TaxID=3129255 RepID=UPI00307724FC
MTIVRRLAFMAILTLITWVAQAQIGPGNPGNPGDPAGDPDAVPITGLEYLLIGGGAYGVSRLMRRKKDKSNDQ